MLRGQETLRNYGDFFLPEHCLTHMVEICGVVLNSGFLCLKFKFLFFLHEKDLTAIVFKIIFTVISVILLQMKIRNESTEERANAKYPLSGLMTSVSFSVEVDVGTSGEVPRRQDGGRHGRRHPRPYSRVSLYL